MSHAEAGGEKTVGPQDRRDEYAQRVGKFGRAWGPVRLDQDRELLASKPSDYPAGRHGVVQDLRDFHQRVVATCVAVLIVQGLEAIDVQEDHADDFTVRLRDLPG